MEAPSDADVVTCTDATEWETWLAEHHGRSRGVWLLIAKKRSNKASVTIGDALDLALCYGWIDSRGGALTPPTTCSGSRRDDRGAHGRSGTWSASRP